jgi:tetratricopeptide (TPR) repeat protein
MSQTELAGTDLSPSYISLIEADKRRPSTEVISAIAHRLGCSVADLTAVPAADEAQARLDLSYARLALTNGEPAVARDRLRGLLSGGLPRDIEDDARHLLADAFDRLGDLDAVIRIRQPLFEAACAGRSHLPVSEVGHPLAFTYLSSGDVHAAIRVGELAIDRSRDAGQVGTDSHRKLEATVVLAYFEIGDLSMAWDKAIRLIDESREHDSATGTGAACWNAALIAESRGDLHQALHLSQRALALFSEQGPSLYVVELQQIVAWMSMSLDPGRAPEAARLLDEGQHWLKELGGSPAAARWEALRSLAHFLVGEFSRAEILARRAVLHFQQLDEPRETAEALMILGDVLTARGKSGDGLDAYRACERSLRRGTPTHRFAAVFRDLAGRFDLAGESGAGRDCLLTALDIARVHGNPVRADIAFGRRAPAPPPHDPPTRTADTAPDGSALIAPPR